MSTEDVYYDSWKENRDLILEYNQVDLEDITVSNIKGIGVDNVSSKQAIVKVMQMIEHGGVHHVISLNPYKLIRYRANIDLNIIYGKASLKFASGAGVRKLSRIVRQPLKERIHFISFLMELIRMSEIKEYTIFLVGARPETTERAYANILKSFPKIRIVGRHGGYFNNQREQSVIEAIRKSEADLVFVGMGFPKEDKWIAKLRMSLQNSVIIGIGGSLDIISGENRKAPAYFMERGLDWFYRTITKPWRYGRLIRILFFYITTFIGSLFISNRRYLR
ncbi:MAG: WecB/TagA/CpsF family glycosyltransferase [Spirochaetes bacterium]|jgi:N-acetylglucosaminyldiphosphoundecaprenol N-acetyl-beta-D-mannosaminyltransferase|nr:WecB/TagA/CpsF family glycosyltransferase [Spirochaetota bacterium]